MFTTNNHDGDTLASDGHRIRIDATTNGDCDCCNERADYRLTAEGGSWSLICQACLDDNIASPMNDDHIIDY